MGDTTKRGIPSTEYEKLFRETSWPAKPVQNVSELKDLLDSGFFGEDPDPYEDDHQYYNFCDHVRKVESLGWINALHDFDGDGEVRETPLIYVLNNDPSDWRTVEFLLSVGADPNLRDSQGKPPLFVFFLGLMVARLRTFNLLMDAGANPKAHYAGKSLAEMAMKAAKESRGGHDGDLHRMIWEDIKHKLNITDDE